MMLTLSVNNVTHLPIYESGFNLSNLDKKLPFVEILWDNYCHLSPEKIKKYLSPFSENIAIHIMWSRFLERDESELKPFLQHLKFHVDEIQPIYVSDHLCQFQQGGIHLKNAMEIDYINIDDVCRRIDFYQEYLEMQVLFENYASITPTGYKQIDFFDEILTRTGCGILFDISNARVAADNGFITLKDWLELLNRVAELHCHVGSYWYNPEFECYQDSHADDLSTDTLKDVKTVLSHLQVESICYEREYRHSGEAIAHELNLLKNIIFGENSHD